MTRRRFLHVLSRRKKGAAATGNGIIIRAHESSPRPRTFRPARRRPLSRHRHNFVLRLTKRLIVYIDTHARTRARMQNGRRGQPCICIIIYYYYYGYERTTTTRRPSEKRKGYWPRSYFLSSLRLLHRHYNKYNNILYRCAHITCIYS